MWKVDVDMESGKWKVESGKWRGSGSHTTHTFDVQAKNAGKAGRVYLYRNRNFRFRGDGGGGNTPRGGGVKIYFCVKRANMQ